MDRFCHECDENRLLSLAALKPEPVILTSALTENTKFRTCNIYFEKTEAMLRYFEFLVM